MSNDEDYGVWAETGSIYTKEPGNGRRTMASKVLIQSEGVTNNTEIKASTNVSSNNGETYTLVLKLVDYESLVWKGLSGIDMDRSGGFILFELRVKNKIKHQVTVKDLNIEYWIIDTEDA